MDTATLNAMKAFSDIVLKLNNDDMSTILLDACRMIRRIIPYKYSLVSYVAKDDSGPKVFRWASEDLPPIAVESYWHRYAAMDYIAWRDAQPIKDAYRESDIYDMELIKHSVLYNTWLKPLGILHTISANCVAHGIIYGSFALMRAEGDEDFSDEELAMFSLINDHISQRVGQLYPMGLGRSMFELGKDELQGIYDLTKREMEIVDCFRLGLSRSAIADSLSIAPNTLKKHLANIYRKLGVNSEARFLALINKPDRELRETV